MTWVNWFGVVVLVSVASAVTYAVGYLLGYGKGWLHCRKQTDPNVVGGFSEHPSVRRAREQRLRREALEEMASAKKHDRLHWN